MIKILTPLCLALLLRVVGHFPRENVCKISYELKETQFPSQTIDPQWTSIQELKSQKRGQYYTIWVLRVGQYFIISYAKTHMYSIAWSDRFMFLREKIWPLLWSFMNFVLLLLRLIFVTVVERGDKTWLLPFFARLVYNLSKSWIDGLKSHKSLLISITYCKDISWKLR